MVIQTRQTEAVFNSACGGSDIAAHAPCNKEDCNYCRFWMNMMHHILNVSNQITSVATTLVDSNAKDDTVQMLQANESALASSNKLKKANKQLNAEKNHINTVSANDRKSTSKPGRKPGCKPTISKIPEQVDREETCDVTVCPHQKEGKAHTLSKDVTDSYYRHAKVLHIMVENVKLKLNRRWCRTCKKQVSATPSGLHRHERVSSNLSAIATGLNLDGLSFGKVEEYCNDTLKTDVSRSWAYRTKIGAGHRMAPQYHDIEKIQDEPYLTCDELWWKMPGSNSAKVMVARGADYCQGGTIDQYPRGLQYAARLYWCGWSGFQHYMAARWCRSSDVHAAPAMSLKGSGTS